MSKKLLGSLELNRIYQRDCIDGMRMIPDKSIDMILCDLPYGTTACKWDTIIPFDVLWAEYERVIKDNGAIVLTASQPFTTALIASNMRLFKYCWVWDKRRPSGFQVAKYRPMMRHEDVCVFGKGRINYFPIMEEREKPIKGRVVSSSDSSPLKYNDGLERTYTHKYPQSILDFPKPTSAVHPTQKPVDLFRYLIRTYTNEGEIVLDNCMGSGTTAVAATLEGRDWIGFETEPEYVEIANKRLDSLEVPQ